MASNNQFDIDIEGLEPVINKFANAPKTLAREMKKAMTTSLDVVHENIPGYPPKRTNQTTSYTRQGILAKSLGVTQGGGKAGKPTIYSVKSARNDVTGTFGTNLSYAKYVIGSPDAPKGEGQAWMHKQWWWTLDFVARKAKDKVVKVWDEFIKRAMDA